MAGRGTADEVQRDANSYRRADQPGAPCYGEDNVHILTELLGYSRSDVERLAEQGVI